MAADRDFADYCLELLSGIGPCTAKRMFGGWGLAHDGMNLALIADLGDGDKLWLKADAETQALFEAQNCQRFTWSTHKKGEPAQMSMGYYTAPVDAMESPLAMAPWARLALDSAHRANTAAGGKKPKSRAKKRPSNRPPGG